MVASMSRRYFRSSYVSLPSMLVDSKSRRSGEMKPATWSNRKHYLETCELNSTPSNVTDSGACWNPLRSPYSKPHGHELRPLAEVEMIRREAVVLGALEPVKNFYKSSGKHDPSYDRLNLSCWFRVGLKVA